MHKSDLERLCSSVVTENLISYLCYRDIGNLRATCRGMKQKIGRSCRYGLVLECQKIKVNRKRQIAETQKYTGFKQETNSIVLTWVLRIILGIFVIPINTIFCKASIIRNIFKKCKLSYAVYKNKRLLKLFYQSLTNAKYMEITKIILPDILSRDNKDLQICIIYNNIATFEFLYKSDYLYEDIYNSIIMYDRLEIFKIILDVTEYTIEQLYGTLVNNHKKITIVYFSPKIMEYYISHRMKLNVNYMVENIELYKKIRDQAIEIGAHEMVESLCKIRKL